MFSTLSNFLFTKQEQFYKILICCLLRCKGQQKNISRQELNLWTPDLLFAKQQSHISRACRYIQDLHLHTFSFFFSQILDPHSITNIMGYQVSYDPRSYGCNFSHCIEKPEKIRTSTGFEPVTSWFQGNALTHWAMKPPTLGVDHVWVLMFLWGISSQSDRFRIANN